MITSFNGIQKSDCSIKHLFGNLPDMHGKWSIAATNITKFEHHSDRAIGAGIMASLSWRS
jgi:hypothetical protein